jgi:hypothetical protein
LKDLLSATIPATLNILIILARDEKVLKERGAKKYTKKILKEYLERQGKRYNLYEEIIESCEPFVNVCSNDAIATETSSGKIAPCILIILSYYPLLFLP